MATEENWKDILRTNYTELLENISTEFGLFGELKKAGIFTPVALKEKFMELKDTTEKIDWILSELQKRDFETFMKFCEALNNSGQAHIVRHQMSTVKVFCCQVMATDSSLNEDSPHCRKISSGVLECFNQHWNDLIHDITFDGGLMSQVEIRKIVTTAQLTKLKDIRSEVNRTKEMLSWLQGGSEKQFLDFCDALKANNQPHLVRQYLTPKIPQPKIPAPNPLVIQETATLSHEIHRAPEIGRVPGIWRAAEIRRDPEGSSGDVPVAAEITVADICFFPCNKEFLHDFQAKVAMKVAYKCDSKPRGRALIMNNKVFTHLSTRNGSNVDTDNLHALFTGLNFDTVVHSDKNAEEMWDILVKESREGHHKGYDMFLLFMMSHGIQGEIYGVDGKSLKTQDIVNQFNGRNCQHLLGKPKLFFIQACQGDVKTVGVTAADGVMTACDYAMPVQLYDAIMEEMMRKLRLEDDVKMSIPLEPLSEFQSDAVADDKVHEMADMAIIYATVGGYVAWRRLDTGSLFVNCLVNVLTKRAHEADLMRIITETFKRLHDLEVVVEQTSYKQIGERRDTLRGEVYLLPL